MAMSTNTPPSQAGEEEAQGGAPAPGPNRKGYPVEIFEDNQDRKKYSCSFCARILRDPMQSFCGHRFCENCQKTIEESSRAGKTELCQRCQDEGISVEESKVNPVKMHQDKGIQKEMDIKTARCCNEKCTYQGLFRDYVMHAEECQFRPLDCNKCGESVSMTKMNDHKNQHCPQRVITCEHCQGQMPFAQMTAHVEECPKAPIACSLCSTSFPREKVKGHEDRECPNRPVTCPLEDCGQSHPQSEFHRHVRRDRAQHLAWVVIRLADLEASLLSQAPSTSSFQPSMLEASGGIPPETTAANITLESLMSRVEEMEQQLQEWPRAAATQTTTAAEYGGGGATMGASVAPSTSGASDHSDRLSAMQVRVESLEPIFSVMHGEMNRLICTITRLEDQIHQQRCRRQECEAKVAEYENIMATLSQSLAQSDTRMLRLEEGVPSLADGTLLWRISNFSQVRQKALLGEETKLLSRPFYTGPVGYKLKICLYPNGDGTGHGTHLSIFLSILRGPHDPLLPWPFRQKVTVMVIDQTFKKHVVDAFQCGDGDSFKRPTSEANTATGLPEFLPLNKLHQSECEYIKDDTLFIRVLVSTEGMNSHFRQFNTP